MSVLVTQIGEDLNLMENGHYKKFQDDERYKDLREIVSPYITPVCESHRTDLTKKNIYFEFNEPKPDEYIKFYTKLSKKYSFTQKRAIPQRIGEISSEYKTKTLQPYKDAVSELKSKEPEINKQTKSTDKTMKLKELKKQINLAEEENAIASNHCKFIFSTEEANNIFANLLNLNDNLQNELNINRDVMGEVRAFEIDKYKVSRFSEVIEIYRLYEELERLKGKPPDTKLREIIGSIISDTRAKYETIKNPTQAFQYLKNIKKYSNLQEIESFNISSAGGGGKKPIKGGSRKRIKPGKIRSKKNRNHKSKKLNYAKNNQKINLKTKKI